MGRGPPVSDSVSSPRKACSPAPALLRLVTRLASSLGSRPCPLTLAKMELSSCHASLVSPDAGRSATWPPPLRTGRLFTLTLHSAGARRAANTTRLFSCTYRLRIVEGSIPVVGVEGQQRQLLRREPELVHQLRVHAARKVLAQHRSALVARACAKEPHGLDALRLPPNPLGHVNHNLRPCESAEISRCALVGATQGFAALLTSLYVGTPLLSSTVRCASSMSTKCDGLCAHDWLPPPGSSHHPGPPPSRSNA